VHRFSRANTDQDPQNFDVRCSLCKLRIQAGTANLNKGKVESRRKGNPLEVIGDLAGVDGTVRIKDKGAAGGVGVRLPDALLYSNPGLLVET
jgi:hypothetical protein